MAICTTAKCEKILFENDTNTNSANRARKELNSEVNLKLIAENSSKVNTKRT